jgi:tungstate transport system permease protein
MILDGIRQGVEYLVGLDPEVWSAIRVSLTVSLSALMITALIGVPAGLFLGLTRFRGRRLLIVAINTMMALPTVLIGLVVYAMISRAGPMGSWELLYTPTAMIIGQVILAFPIVTGLCAAAAEKADPRILQTALALGASRWRAGLVVAAETRATLGAAVIAAFGRVFAEVGISMMLGGNIQGYTRNISTGIAFETGKGEFARGVALGLTLLVFALGINFIVGFLQTRKGRR